MTDDPVPVSWDRGQSADFVISDLEKSPQAGAQYGDLAPAAGQARSYAGWSRDFADWAYRSQGLELLRSPSFGEVSRPDESERDFRVRLQQAAREKRDDAVDDLRRKYASKVATLQDRVRRAQEKVEREASQAKQAKVQTAVNFGTTLIGALMGRNRITSTTVTRAGSAARAMGRSSRESQDVARAEDSLEAVQMQLKDLQAEFDAEVAALEARMDPLRENLESVMIRPKKTDIAVQLVSLVWAPYWQDAQRNLAPAW
jgi:FtsZ-binding cell division protein ZapB